MNINTTKRGLGCWECPHLKSAEKRENSIFCLKHNTTIADRLEATYFDWIEREKYCLIQCDEPQVMAIERKSW
jgi:hypothetical protein